MTFSESLYSLEEIQDWTSDQLDYCHDELECELPYSECLKDFNDHQEKIIALQDKILKEGLTKNLKYDLIVLKEQGKALDGMCESYYDACIKENEINDKIKKAAKNVRSNNK